MSIEPKDDFVEIAERRAQTAIDLTRARHMIANGWCQDAAIKHSFFLRRVKFCTTAAIGEACGQGNLDRIAEAVNVMFDTTFPGSGERKWEHKCACLQGWNDEYSRTKKEVLAAFDKAITSVWATV